MRDWTDLNSFLHYAQRSSITAVGTLDKPRLIAQTLPVPIVGYTLLAAVFLLI